MKEVFRNSDGTLVDFYRAILEEAEIPCLVQNDATQPAIIGNLVAAMLPLPDFWPTLCVLNDDDYPEAISLLSEVRESANKPHQERKCAHCGEMVPDNFSECWNCGKPFSPEGTVP